MMRQLCVLAAIVWGTMTTSTAWSLPSGFTKTKVASGLSLPTSMAFAPDGRIFVTERGTGAGGTGKVRIIKNGALLATPFVSITTDNSNISANERGLLGLALDPDIATNHFVYVYYTVPGNPPHNRISRFTANGDVAVAGSEQRLLDLDNLKDGNHNGGPLHFGADGKLYIGVGENHNAPNAVNLNNHLGKILRINKDGSVPSDNPFYDASDGIGAKDRIYTYGHRNPFTFDVQPGTGRIFVNDVGESTWEEVNDLVAGKDYGWRGGSSDGDASAFYKYNHSDGKCIAGGTFFNPAVAQGGWSAFVGRWFFGDYTNGWIHVLNPSNKAVSTFETGINGPIDIDVGPDGNLYYLTINGGEIWKVTTTTTTVQELVLSTNALDVGEGQSNGFTVRLATQPSATISVGVARTQGETGVTVSPASLTFTADSWSTPQIVTVRAAEDADNVSSSAVVTVSAPNLTSKTVVVNDVDNDTGGPVTLISLPHDGDIIFGSNAEFYGGSNLDGSTAKGEFYIDGKLAYSDVGPGHYHWKGSHAQFDTTVLAEGAHALKLTVYDQQGRSGSHAINVTVDNLPDPWLHQDVGSVAAQGSASAMNGVFTLKGSGADIWNAADAFQYVYRTLVGDGEIRARVTAVGRTNDWAKGGVMIRDGVAANARNAVMYWSGAGIPSFQWRATAGGTSQSTHGNTPVAGPLWVRLVRAGNTITGYTSADGNAWTQAGSASIAFGNTVTFGLIATAHADGQLSTATIDSVAITGNAPFVVESASVDGEATGGNGAAAGCALVPGQAATAGTGGALGVGLLFVGLALAYGKKRRARSRF
jgi:glucose/arabinose dehydrogenase